MVRSSVRYMIGKSVFGFDLIWASGLLFSVVVLKLVVRVEKKEFF